MIKILIAVPTFENIYPDTFKSIYNLEIPENVSTDFSFVRGYDCARARSNIVTAAEGYDYVLMVDNDTVLPKDALKLLLEDGENVVLGYYAHRVFNAEYDGRTNLCKPGEFNYTSQFSGEELKKLREEGTYKIQIHGGGLGCALIKLSVFDRMQVPYFDWVNYQTGYVLSEDLYFAEQCKRISMPMYADTRVECGHMYRHIQYCK